MLGGTDVTDKCEGRWIPTPVKAASSSSPAPGAGARWPHWPRSSTSRAETIRRDLKVLAGRRMLKRVHGGAVPLETAAFESGVEYRSQVDLAQKHRIAAAASRAATRRRNGLSGRGFHADG